MDIINKTIGVLIAFAIIVGGGLTIKTIMLDASTERQVFIEVQNFIDKVEDTGQITDQDLSDLYVNTSVNGVTMSIDVTRDILTMYPTDALSGDTKVVYVESTDISKFNKGDRVNVHVQAVDYTPAQRLQWILLNLYTGKIDINLSGVVENNG